MQKAWDVIIVGAGPAGSTLGYELGKRGVRSLILEKEVFPRYKTCAAGLNVRLVNSLDFDVSSVVEETIYGFALSLRMRNPFTVRTDRPVTLTTTREKFDHLLLGKAREAGCQVREGEKVELVEIRKDGVRVGTSKGEYLGLWVAGADGANSRVAQKTGLRRRVRMSIGIESEVEVGPRDLEYWRSLVFLDLASVRNGYGWIFPKRDHLSIGVWGPRKHSKTVAAYYKRFSEKWRSTLHSYHVRRQKAHLLPIRTGKTAIEGQRCLLLGDAAGLIDPVTGEGIYYAIKSAQLASEVLAGYLEAPVSAKRPADYQRVVDERLMPEIQRSRAFAVYFDLFPDVFLEVMKRGQRLRRNVCDLLRGSQSYTDIGRKLGPFEFLLDLITC